VAAQWCNQVRLAVDAINGVLGVPYFILSQLSSIRK